MMKKPRIPLATFLSLVLLTVGTMLVCLLPWPTHVEVKMSGALLYGQMVVEEPVYVTVRGYMLDYLFLPDRVDFRFLQSGIDDWMFTESKGPDTRWDQRYGTEYIISNCGLYNNSENRMGVAYYAFSVEEQMLLIYIMDDLQPVIACSINGEKTPSEIIEYFDVFVDGFSMSD